MRTLPALLLLATLVSCGGGSSSVVVDADPGQRAVDGAPGDAAAGDSDAASSARCSSGPLARYTDNPILENGPDAFDAVKVGPRVVLRDGNGYRMWYEAVPGANRSTVGFATSADGLNWQKQSEVLAPSEAWEGGPDGEVSPNSILFEGGAYRLWYHSYDGSNRRIGTATSSDGIAWVKRSEPVLDLGEAGAWDSEQVAEPRIIRVGDEYRMYYAGMGAVSGWRLGLATSSDGINFTRHPESPLFRGTEGSGYGIVVEGDDWHMWYADGGGLHYASSSDGIAWTDGPSNPVLLANADSAAPDSSLGDSVSAYRDQSTCRILYAGFNFTASPRRSICMAEAPAE